MKQRRKRILIVFGCLTVIFLLFNFLYLKSSAQARKIETQQIDSILKLDNQVVCTIKLDKTIHRIWQRPSIVVSIQNNTDSVISLTGSLDGSGVKSRLPYCYFEITRNGFKYSPGIPIGCGNTNGVRVEDYVLLKPGESFDPYEKIDEYGFFGNYSLESKNYWLPGIYTMQFFYTNYEDSVSKEEFYKPVEIDTSFSIEDQNAIKKVQEFRQKEPMIRIKSNKITLIYRVI